jgi:hypothetical protein
MFKHMHIMALLHVLIEFTVQFPGWTRPDDAHSSLTVLTSMTPTNTSTLLGLAHNSAVHYVK